MCSIALRADSACICESTQFRPRETVRGLGRLLSHIGKEGTVDGVGATVGGVEDEALPRTEVEQGEVCGNEDESAPIPELGTAPRPSFTLLAICRTRSSFMFSHLSPSLFPLFWFRAKHVPRRKVPEMSRISRFILRMSASDSLCGGVDEPELEFSDRTSWR